MSPMGEMRQVLESDRRRNVRLFYFALVPPSSHFYSRFLHKEIFCRKKNENFILIKKFRHVEIRLFYDFASLCDPLFSEC